MKKLLLTISLGLIVVMGYSQATPSGEFRIADATTDFGVNLPIGSKIFCVATGKYYVAIAPIPADDNLTDAIGNSDVVGISDLDLVLKTDSSYSLASSTGDTTMLVAATSTEAGLMTAAMFNKFDTVGIYAVQAFEIAADAAGGVGTVTLTSPPVTGTPVTVSLNGYELKLTDQFTIDAAGEITFVVPIYQYDQVTVSYTRETI